MTLHSYHTHCHQIPFDFRHYKTSLQLDLERSRADVPIRAKSVCLKERPRSQYSRVVRSADLIDQSRRHRQLFYPTSRPQSTSDFKQKPAHRKSSRVAVKQQNRKPPPTKVPCAVSVQTLSIPMKYADGPPKSTNNSTFNRQRSNLCAPEALIDGVKTKISCNLDKQVSGEKRREAEVHGKGTENKLLVQISEADQVADFERILNSNAILWERARRQVWRGTRTVHTPATLSTRPRSTYSLHAVSETYHYLFRQHEESLRPLIEKYREATADGRESKSAEQNSPRSILGRKWYDDLQDLSEFYDEDHALREEIEAITDRIITEEVKATEEAEQCTGGNKNFNVNLADLISVKAVGDSFSPVPNQDESDLSLEVGRGVDNERTDDGKEWLTPIMSANSEDSRQHSQENNDEKVDNLTHNFTSVHLEDNENLPTITFSNCTEVCPRSELPNNTNLTIHLTVPITQCIDESRPPI